MIRAFPTSDLQLGFQLLGDLLLVSVLVFVTGGVGSPFALLFGLIIVAAGSQAQPMLVLTVGLAAGGCYLGGTYLAAWYDNHLLSVNDSLSILLQVSMLLLAGGVMATIARRHQRLRVERSQAARLHRNLQALHGQIMETMNEGILVLDGLLRVYDCNQAACNMLADGADIQGATLSEVLTLPARLRRFFDDGNRAGCHCEFKRAGRTLLLSAACMPANDDHAKWMISMVDVTDFRQLEQKLAGQEKLAAMGRMAAMLAHEIRNPLQSIAQSIEILSNIQSKKRQEVRDIMLEEVQHLNHLVSDMLDYTQPLKPEPCAVDMPALIRAAIHQVDVQGDRSIHHSCTCDRLEIDADHFRLVLDNLLRNAVSASPEAGSVRVHFGMIDNGHWMLKVEDEGGGVPERVRRHLFEPFVSSKTDGTGLGLATVWQVCQSNGWNVKLDILEHEGRGKGSKFMVSGPKHAQAGQDPA